jgi:hypothetical protein
VPAAAAEGSSGRPQSPGHWRCRGWRSAAGRIFTIAWPLTVVDSMCSMLSTVVVRIRSYGVVTRPSISSRFNPVNCHATATTGMSMLGKMSVGVRRMRTGLTIRMSRARTTNVYGRSSAILTIHMSLTECKRRARAARTRRHGRSRPCPAIPGATCRVVSGQVAPAARDVAGCVEARSRPYPSLGRVPLPLPADRFPSGGSADGS